MTKNKWNAFCKFKSAYKKECIAMLHSLQFEYRMPVSPETSASTCSSEHNFSKLQAEAAVSGGTPPYPVETPIVYNHSWDDISENDNIKLIIVGDNPGKNEQLHKNQRYLVGQAGKIADGFFKNHPELGIDFRKNVIILNKTPIHTAKTKQLSFILKNDNSGKCQNLFKASQIFAVQKMFELQQELQCPVWIVGYAELKVKGLFSTYAEKLKELYTTVQHPELYLFQHFSMNRFLIDFKANIHQSLSTEDNLKRLGISHRREILHF